jgi:hypothetical protein
MRRIAIFGGAIAFVGAISLAVIHEPESSTTYDKEKTTEKPQNESSPLAGDIAGYRIQVPGIYQSKCDRPENRDDADLCEQQRAANAGEKMVWWTRLQFIAGALTIAFLGWTIYENRRTANAAIRAADAADRSARAAIGIELPILRFYPPTLMYADVATLPPDRFSGQVNDGPLVRFSAVSEVKFKNEGRTPAFPTAFHVGWFVGSELPEKAVYKKTTPWPPGGILHAGKEGQYGPSLIIDITDIEVKSIRAGESIFWLYFAVDYLDFMREPHTERECWTRPSPPIGGDRHRFTIVTNAPKSYTERT